MKFIPFESVGPYRLFETRKRTMEGVGEAAIAVQHPLSSSPTDIFHDSIKVWYDSQDLVEYIEIFWLNDRPRSANDPLSVEFNGIQLLATDINRTATYLKNAGFKLMREKGTTFPIFVFELGLGLYKSEDLDLCVGVSCLREGFEKGYEERYEPA